MRSLILTLSLGFALLFGRFATDCQGQLDVPLSWNPSTNANVAGYYLEWGTTSGIYTATNIYAPNQTAGVISNLSYNVVYYIAVAAFTTNGLISPLSNEAIYSNSTPPVVTNDVLAGSGPPPPPAPGSGKPNSGKGSTSPNGSGSGVGSASGTTPGGGSTAGTGSTGSTNLTQAQIWGIPPVLNLGVTNNTPTLTIGGTVGATVNVMASGNLSSPYSWTVVTNVALTNAASFANSNTVPGQPQDPIDLAYVPALQTTDLPGGATNGAQFFKVVMPYDYIILAGMTLPPKGYTARLIVVNMPGLNDDCCYVSEAGSFIHYSATNSALQLAGSGSTIRQIASTMANNLNLDWTTASEFVYSNGMGQLLATVVESDPASSDPVAGTAPTSSIVINF